MWYHLTYNGQLSSVWNYSKTLFHLRRSTRHPTQTMPSGIALPTMDLNRERLVSSLSQSLEGRKCYFLNCVSPSFPKMGHMEPRISSGKGSKTGGKHDPRTMRRRVCFLFSLLSSSNYCFLTQGRLPEEVVCHWGGLRWSDGSGEFFSFFSSLF